MAENENVPGGANSPVIKAAVEAALATERRFNNIESSQRDITLSIKSLEDSLHRDIEALKELVTSFNDGSQQRDAANSTTAQTALATSTSMTKQLQEELAWRTGFLVEWKEALDKLTRLWDAADTNVIVRKLWSSQLKWAWAAVGFFGFVIPSWANFMKLLGLL